MGTLSKYSVSLTGTRHISVGDVAELQFDRTDAFTLSAWVLNTSTGTRMICSKGSNTSGYSFFMNSKKLYFDLVNTFPTNTIEVYTTDDVFMQNVWNHVVVTYDGYSAASGVTIYINGVSQTLTTNYDTLSATILNSNPFDIGTRAGSFYWSGYVDEVSVYNKELSAAEVITIFNDYDPPDLTSTGPVADLVGYWKIGDGDTYPTATDSSSSANDGTYTNTTSADIIPNGAGGPQSIGTAVPLGYAGDLFGGSIRTITNVFAPCSPTPPTPSTVYYFMQAFDSFTSAQYTWVAVGSPDWTGAYYPGPNSPTGTAISSTIG